MKMLDSLKKRSKKGFTLAELLIVIAIIAILVAIMFPVFGAQLSKARLAADLANVRAAYSEMVADQMLGENDVLTPDDTTTFTITIAVSELEAACQYGSEVNAEDNTVTVTYGEYSGSFTVDEDVTFS